MRMEIDEWREKVGHHLDMIGAGADICVRHAERLPLRPDFATLCEAELDRCEATLEIALAKVRQARTTFRGKPTED